MSDNSTADAYVTAEWIRRPLVDLGGLSPADAAADAEGRKKLDDLMVELAGHHVRFRHLGLPAVNPDDIRKALGIEKPTAPAASRSTARPPRAGPVKRSALLDELGTALTGGDVDSVAFFNVKTGAVEHFMHNLGDQENARIAEAQTNPDLKKISPVTTEVRYGIMSDFISMVEDITFAGRLRTAISGKGAFRRFRETVDEDDALRRRWLAYRTKRHYHLALDWLDKLELDPAKFGLNPSDFDWEKPTHREAEEPAPVAKGEGQKPTEAAVPTEAARAEATPLGEAASAEVAVGEPAPQASEAQASEAQASEEPENVAVDS